MFLWTLKLWEYRFGGKNPVNYKKKNHDKTAWIMYLTQMHFFLLLRGATWYYKAIYIIFTYFASFIGFEEDILKVISNLHVQGAKFGRKKDIFGGQYLKNLNSAEYIAVNHLDPCFLTTFVNSR